MHAYTNIELYDLEMMAKSYMYVHICAFKYQELRER